MHFKTVEALVGKTFPGEEIEYHKKINTSTWCVMTHNFNPYFYRVFYAKNKRIMKKTMVTGAFSDLVNIWYKRANSNEILED